MSSVQLPDDDQHSVDAIQDGLGKAEPRARLSSPSSTGSTPPRSDSSSFSQRSTYAAAVSKGRKLLDLTLTPSTSRSKFTSAAQLKDWGYTTTPQTAFPHNHKDTWALLELILPTALSTRR